MKHKRIRMLVLTIMGTEAAGVVPSAAQFPSVANLDALDGRTGFVVDGYFTQEFGWSVAGIGDVNGDGIDDIASGGPGVSFPPIDCGAPWDPCPDCEPTPGAVNVLFGQPGIGGDGLWSLDDPLTHVLRIQGLHPNDQTDTVAPAGDFNDDGIADFLVGAQYASPGGIDLAGVVYVIYGSPGLSKMDAFDLNTLDGSNGFLIAGGFPWGGLGRRLAALGDFNGDRVDDIAIGAPAADPPGRPNAGQVYILFGGRGIGEYGTFTVPNSLTPKQGIVLNGASPGDFAGGSVASAGDFNGDGLDDLVTISSVEPEDGALGQVYVVYGGLDAGQYGVFDLGALDGRNGFVINGPPGPPESINPTVLTAPRGVGDINADGFADIAIAVDVAGSGDWVGVLFGGAGDIPSGIFDLENLDGRNGARIASFGRAAPAGDVNADGVADLMSSSIVLFGSPGFGVGGQINALDMIDGQQGFLYQALYSYDRGFAGDVNCDGMHDMIVGRRYYDDDLCNIGRVHVLFGRRMGDGDLDADVDFLDFGAFQTCFRSETMNTNPDGKPDVPDACHPFDFDKDNDVDLFDYAVFQKVFGSPPLARAHASMGTPPRHYRLKRARARSMPTRACACHPAQGKSKAESRKEEGRGDEGGELNRRAKPAIRLN